MAEPRLAGRLAAAAYLINILTGAAALFLDGAANTAAILIATIAYVAVTLLFYGLFRAVSPWLSAVVAVPSLVGCALSALTALHIASVSLNPLGLFGLYCLGLGYLIRRSIFVPGWIGICLMLAGLSWSTFFFPSLAERLTPYNMAPGILAEGALTVWLLAVGIDPLRWSSQAAAHSAG